MACSPDGSRLATVSREKVMRLWDARTGQVLAHTNGVTSVAFSPNGTRLATGGDDKTVRLWDGRTGRSLAELKGLKQEVSSVAFSSDGTQLTGWARTPADVIVWDVGTGEPVRDGKPTPPMDQSRSTDGRWLAVADGKIVRLVDMTLRPDADELAYRLYATRGDPDWHSDQMEVQRQLKNWYAAVYHVNHLLESRPGDADLLAGRRAIMAEAVQNDPKDAAALSAHARLSLEAGKPDDYRKACAALSALAASEEADRRTCLAASVVLAPDVFGRAALAVQSSTTTKDDAMTRRLAATCVLAPEALPDLKPLLAAFDMTLTGPKKYPEDLCIQAGLLLRAGQPEEAVKRLLAAKKDRDDTPREDLLLALAYHQLKRPDDAKKCLARAVVALDRTRHELAAGNAVLSGGASPLHALTGLQQPTLPDWREHMLGWQGWLDLQLLRREAEGALKP
jgi:tetratricopeptide (TPR) repeat protein